MAPHNPHRGVSGAASRVARPGPGSRARRGLPLVLAGVLLLVLLLLVVAQLVLPRIAEQRLRDRLARSGTVLKVEVDAFPAIELLWRRADRVVVKMGDYSSGQSTLTETLAHVADAGSVDASAAILRAGLLTVRNATLQKRGNELTASATVTQADLRASLPVLSSVTPVASSGGEVTLQGTASVLGAAATVDVTARPEDGALVVSPDVPFGAFATITLFSTPVIAVQSVAAGPAPGGFVVSARARVS